MKTLNKMDIQEFIKKQLSELLDIDTNEIKNDDNLIDFGATSMIIVQLYLYLQEEYNIHLEDELDLYKNQISINEIIKSIERLGLQNE